MSEYIGQLKPYIGDLLSRVDKRLSEDMSRLAATDFESDTDLADFTEALYELNVMNKLHSTLSMLNALDTEEVD